MGASAAKRDKSHVHIYSLIHIQATPTAVKAAYDATHYWVTDNGCEV